MKVLLGSLGDLISRHGVCAFLGVSSLDDKRRFCWKDSIPAP